MTVARVSQSVAEVIRKNTAVKARSSQVVAEVLRKEIISVNARVSQSVAIVISGEKTLSASFGFGLSVEADLVPGIYLGATLDVPLTMQSRIEAGTELAAVNLPLFVIASAALQAESRLSATVAIPVTLQAGLEEGIEFNATLPISIQQRAGLKVHPESVTGFFLLF